MASNASVTVKSVRAAGGKKLLALFGLLSVGCTAALYAQTPPAYTYVHEVVVVLPTDNGNNASPLQGTLRWAIMQANSREGGKTRIRFNIPPAFGTPPYVIQVEPSRPLPNITKPTIIDGTTQPANGYTGNAPKIILQGRNDNSPNRTDLVTAGLGLNRGSNGSIVKGLQVRYFLYGIMMKETAGILIDGNVIYGLYSLGKNLGIGIDITRTENSFLRNNIIGTDPAGTVFPAQANGIWVSDNSDYCFIGEAGQGNRIVNLLNGIRVGSSGPAYHVRVTESLIYDVLGYPILIADDSNTPRGKTPPVISEVDVNLGEISGTTGHAGDRVEVFACSPNNVAQTGDGKTYIGSATTNALGEWTLTGFNYTSGQNVFSATRTDLQNNTSHFSPPFVINPCELVRTNQNPVIRITSPAPFSEAGVTDNINWTITSVPALTPQTDNKHTVRLQVAPEKLNPDGTSVPDRALAIQRTITYVPGVNALFPGSYQDVISAFLASVNREGNYYVRAGIQYELPDAFGHQPVIWSPEIRFTLRSASPPSAPYLASGSHTDSINWVYGVSYIENGVPVEGISYIDGLGKSRQVQSRLNSQNKVLAVETAYSEEGGGSVSTLPAPVPGTSFGYAPRFFDVFSADAWHDFSGADFDRKIKGGGLKPPSAVDNSQPGSVGQYYSSGNSQEPFADNAQGYPYTSSLGYEDPLSRPMLTGAGAGSILKVTGGREYTHFYGNPSQQELDRVFGARSVNGSTPPASSIYRTTVIDPNGVGSLTYKDNEGKVIATAITACAPPSLSPLPLDLESGQTGFTVHIDPLATDVFDPSALRKRAGSTFFIPCGNTSTTLNYSLNLSSFQVSGYPCKECKYDVTVRITNEQTGAVAYEYSSPLVPSQNVCSGSPELVNVISNHAITLDGPASFRIFREIKPYVDPVTGEDVVTQTIREYLALLHSTGPQTFSALYNSQEAWYLLRKIKTAINAPLYNDQDLCWEVGTFTGTGDSCNTAGVRNLAEYNQPRAIARDNSGNYYIADGLNNCIRRISSKGAVDELAGKSCANPGSADGTGENARFSEPYDIVYGGTMEEQVVDDPGNHTVNTGISAAPQFITVPFFYIADKGNSLIRKMSGTGKVTTFVAAGTLSSPEGLGMDKSGNLYVASTGNNKIYKVTPSGTVTLFAGTGASGSADGSAATATFNQPSDVAFDDNGNLYVAERGGRKIRKISSGTVTTVAGSGSQGSTDAAGISASFHSPSSIAYALGNLFVSDAGNHKIRRVNLSNFNVSTAAGTGAKGFVNAAAASSQFRFPGGLLIDNSANMFLADVSNHAIRYLGKVGCTGNPAPQTEYLWYADEVTVKNLAGGGVKLTDLDGDQDNDQVPGDEEYGITGVSLNSALNSSSTQWISFIDAYDRMHWRNLTGKISSMQLYNVSVPAGGLLTATKVPAFGDDKELFANDPQDYFLLKVTLPGPTCEEKCTTRTSGMPCNDQCEEQRQGYKAEMDDAYKKLSASVNVYNSYTLKQLTDNFYPLTNQWFSTLKDPDDDLYIEYENKRDAYERFSVQDCELLCGGTQPTPCQVCQTNYHSCVYGHMDELTQGYQHLITKWDAQGSFPYTYNDLMPFAPGTQIRAPHTDELEKLGRLLFDYLKAQLLANASMVRSDWNARGGVCSTCAPPSHGNDCPAGATRDVSLMPTKLLSILAAANQKCLDEYNACFQIAGGSSSQDAYMCQQMKDRCVAALGPNPPAAAVAACQGMDCSSAKLVYRETRIREVLLRLYPDPEDAGKIDTLAQDLLTATAGLSLTELEKYLFVYEIKQRCLLDCQKEFDTRYREWLEEQEKLILTETRDQFINGCFGNLGESLDLFYQTSYYHYTLYYYDKGNNLVATVPPEGVDYINVESSDPAERNRQPAHRMKTTYEPSSLYTLSTASPDEGRTEYLYDVAGRIRFSQNAEQRARGIAEGRTIFSYTKYDNEMRVIETGESRKALAGSDIAGFKRAGAGTYAEDKVNDPAWPPADTYEQTFIDYDTRKLSHPGYKQDYLNGRVSRIMNLGSAVHFSYDAHGRVSFIVNEIYIFGNSARHKTVDYIYGPLTGRIEQVIYQKGNQNEEFRHRYSYDADGRLVKAEVSLNGTTWSPAAEYAYYLHGPLKRARLGDNVQDVDYAYNINGWLKAINNVLPLPGEGQVTVGAPGRDVFSEVLHYYSGDYQRLGTGLETTALVNPAASTGIRTSGPDLFNGNIAIAVSYTGFDQVTGNTTLPVMGQSYRYDYLNRLSRVFTETYSAAAFPGYADVQDIVPGISDPYSMRMTYDANGNILSLKRNAALRTFVPQAGSSMGGGTTPQTSTELDKLAYKYTATVTDHYGVVRKTNNRLSQVVDTAHSEGLGDIFTQTSGNYEYDEKGRLTKDLKNDIEKIEWTAYDKVKKITRTSGSTLPGIEYTYDSRQQRLTKKLVYATAALNETTIYVYDAAGVLMAAYTQYFDAATSTLKVRLDEEYMYGLSRLGVYRPAAVRGALTLGQLRFELTDHLGNVRAVVSGQKKANNDANILSLTDYYAFGQTMPGRTFVSEEYRYGYQGSEREAQLEGGSAYTTDYRMLDVRIGRWFSTDMVTQPWQSPFTSMDNDPVNLTDIMGLFAGGGGKGGNEDDFVYKNSEADNEGRYVFKSQGNSAGSNTFNSLGISLVNAIGVNVYNSTKSNQVQRYSEEQSRTAKIKSEDGSIKMKPASEYNYTQETIPEKFTEDWNYILNGKDGNPAARFWDLLKRDWYAATTSERIEAAMLVLFRVGKVKFLKDIPGGPNSYRSALFKSEGDAWSTAWKILGKKPVKIDEGKWRSIDGKFQLRAKPGDVNGSKPHIHIEKIDPSTGKVLENWHFYY